MAKRSKISRERLLEIWSTSVREPRTEEEAKEWLAANADQLARDNYDWLAKAISGYLLGETSLGRAFGLIKRRGKPAGKTLATDVKVFEMRWAGKSWMEIGDATGMDKSNAEKLWNCEGRFKARHLRALSEIYWTQNAAIGYKPERTTAIHEAGHAVAFYRLWPTGRMGGDVSIIANLDEGTAGSHEALEALEFLATDDPEELDRQNEEFAKGAIYSCAGYAAVRAAGYPEDMAAIGCGSDFEAAERYSTPLEPSKQRAVEILAQPENVAAVARVADELIARGAVDADEVQVLIDVADGNATEDEYQQYRRLRRRT